MSTGCFSDQKKSIPLFVVEEGDFSTWVASQLELVRRWLIAADFKGKAGTFCLVPNSQGQLQAVVVCVSRLDDLYGLAALPLRLPQGVYHLHDHTHAFEQLLGWGLGCYQFTRYKKAESTPAQITVPSGISQQRLENILSAIYLVRDLINTPTEDLGPEQLAQAARNLADEFNGDYSECVGDELLEQGFNAIHAVGRASPRAPRLIDLHFGDPRAPAITLVGKGVCFDSGGLDLKNASGMLTMKKDMAGAAHVLGLARMILVEALPVRLRVLIPAVENVVSGNSYRPGDVIKMRSGKTVEITNTDAEGRLILADALHAAVEKKPELLINIASLTGAARVALGTDLAGLFSNQDTLSSAILEQAKTVQDPTWLLPLYSPYRDLLKSPIADFTNAVEGGYGGAITAALFLQEFVPETIPWMHWDIMAWNNSQKPGRPMGGEAMGIRAIFGYLLEKYGKK